MAVSVFDIFKIGIGPSSSHTVGPMRAAARFMTRWLDERGLLEKVVRVRAELFGSLALTGRGHGTDKAVLCGLEGEWPDRIDPDVIPEKLERIRNTKKIRLLGKHEIDFDEKKDLVFNKRQKLPYHSNGMRFSAFDAEGNELANRDYYSVGGRGRYHAASLSVFQRQRVVGALRGIGPLHCRRDAGKRKGLAFRIRSARRSPANLACHAVLRCPRHARGWDFAGRPQGETARTGNGCKTSLAARSSPA